MKKIETMLKHIKRQLDRQNTNWLSLKQAVDFTSLSESTLRRAVKSGHLHASTTTGKLLFEVKEIINWLKGGDNE